MAVNVQLLSDNHAQIGLCNIILHLAFFKQAYVLERLFLAAEGVSEDAKRLAGRSCMRLSILELQLDLASR